jgi:hypothetical protein
MKEKQTTRTSKLPYLKELALAKVKQTTSMSPYKKRDYLPNEDTSKLQSLSKRKKLFETNLNESRTP